MRILFISANPNSTEKLDLNDELRNLHHSLQGHDVDITLLPAAQPADLKQALEAGNYHVVHFSGHGKDEGILMRNVAGNQELLKGPKLRELLAKSTKKIELVFLNACDSREVAADIKSAVGMAIGTHAKLDDKAAKAMTNEFYKSVAEGNSLGKAYNDASGIIRKYFPKKHVYDPIGTEEETEKVLLPDDRSEALKVKMRGLPAWDKNFHVSHLEREITALTKRIRYDQTILGVLLFFGFFAFLFLIWTAYPFEPEAGSAQAAAETNPALVGTPPTEAEAPAATEEATSFIDRLLKNINAFITKKPLLEWLGAVGSGIPLFIASFKNQFLISGNETLRLLKQLLDTVKSSDRMSKRLQQRLHLIMEQSVQGAHSK